MHNKNQPRSLRNSGDSYKEDLKIRMWKMTLQYFEFVFSIFLHAKNQLPMCSGSRIFFVGGIFF